MKMHNCFDGLLAAIPKTGVTGVAGVTPNRKPSTANNLTSTAHCNTVTTAGVPCVSAQPVQHLPAATHDAGVSDQAPEIIGNSKGETPAPPETPWREMYEERAGAMEFEAGFPRDKAEAMAYWDTFAQFACRQHPTLVAEFEALLHRPHN